MSTLVANLNQLSMRNFNFYREKTNINMIGDSTGAYDVEESAARAYDLAALKYWGTSTFTNFPVRISYMRISASDCNLCT